MTTYILTSQKETIDVIAPIFKRHNLKVICNPVAFSQVEPIGDFLSQARKLYFQDNSNVLALLPTKEGTARLGIYLSASDDFSWFEATGSRNVEKVFSEYIVKFRSSPIQELSCRDDVSVLKSFVTETGAVAFKGDPKSWITSSPFLRKLDTPMYSHLVNFALNERGMFPKVWQMEAQKNYWNSTYNSGLPIVKKRDPIHEGTFMLHDIWHFVFVDPIIIGKESELDTMTYVANRLMSEAFTVSSNRYAGC